MKTRLLFFVLLVALTTMGFDCFNDPIVAAIDLTPLSGQWKVNLGPGTFDDRDTLVIGDFIDPSYKDKIEKLRIFDIIVGVTTGYPSGVVSGDGYFSFDGGASFQHLLHFNGQYSAYETGVSLLNPGVLVTYDPLGLPALINALSDINNLPQQVILRGIGSGPAVTANFNLFCTIKLQADAEI